MTASANKSPALMDNINPVSVLPEGLVRVISDAMQDVDARIAKIDDPISKDEIADRTFKYLVASPLGRRAVLIVSSLQFPHMVSRAVSRLEMARGALNSRSQRPIETPIAHGLCENISYGLWLYRRPLSRNRLYRLVQVWLLTWNVYPWLISIAQQTQCRNLSVNVLKRNFEAPLNVLRSHPSLKPSIKTACELALRRLEHTEWRPVHILQHGDLWLGNVLIKGPLKLINPVKCGFTVIDWAGATLSGYPFFDLIKFLMSGNISPRRAAHYFLPMSHIVGCALDDVASYLLCALGRLHQELEHFPEPRFIELCHSTFDFVRRARLGANAG